VVQTGDIVFIKNTSWISKLIVWWAGLWSHNMGIINYDREIVEATIPRVRKANLSIYKGLQYAILTTKTPLTDEEKSILVKFWTSKIGVWYDWRGILSFPLRRNIGNKNYFFCSELIIEGYRLIGRELLRSETSWVTPADLYKSTELKIIEEGIL